MNELTGIAEQGDAPEIAGGSGSQDRLAKQRSRLQMLRGNLSSNPSDPSGEASPAKGKAAGRQGAAGRIGARLGANKSGPQWKAAAQIYQILTDTPPDEAGLVQGTPFTHTGVVRTVKVLRERSSKDTSVGAKMAAWVLNFLTPSEGESGLIVHEVSVEKLKRIARLGQALKIDGGKAA